MKLNEHLRLEVEVPPTELPNLVPNPSGELGAWGWLTPVSNTVMGSDIETYGESVLWFRTNPSQAARFTTMWLPANEGLYYSARLDIKSITASHNIKLRFEFADGDLGALSPSTQGAAKSSGTAFYGPALAPATTEWVRLRADFYNGVSNPSASANVWFNKAMVTETVAGSVQSIRTNLVTNPSFETGTTGWTATVGSITRTSGGHVGSWHCRISNSGIARSAEIAVSAGKNYALSYYGKSASQSKAKVTILWFRSNGNSITLDVRNPTFTGSFARKTMLVTAPSNAASARIYIEGGIDFDAVLFEQADTALNYFDGATTDTSVYDYAWGGTAHASVSTETTISDAFNFTGPSEWRNILAPATEVTIERHALDIGTLQATITDALLDPAVSSDLAPGRAIRLVSLIDDEWDAVFTGHISNADVYYTLDQDKGGNPDLKTTIRLTAYDNISRLANQLEPRGVSDIDELPFILEDKGVPWNVNGSGNQVSSATQTSFNENASTLDQVALTRDAVSGYAWVDRYNVLNAYDANVFNGTPNVDYSQGFESGTGSWVSGTAWSLSRSSAKSRTGTYSLRAIKDGVGDITIDSPHISLSPGTTYTFTVYTRAATSPRQWRLDVRWYTAANAYISTTYSNQTTNSTNTWTKYTGTGVAPANASYAILRMQVWGTVANEVHYFDDVLITSPTDPFVGQYVVYSDVADVGDDHDEYIDIDAGYNTEEVINQVVVKWLRYNDTTKNTEEITYSGAAYNDYDSQKAYGVKQSTFTLQGAAEVEANIEAFAQSVLEQRAQPRRRANSITVYVEDDRGISHATKVDLYSQASVQFQDIINSAYRITSIKHTITPEHWFVEYGFAVDGDIASPQFTPSPGGKGEDGSTTISGDVTFTDSVTLGTGSRVLNIIDYGQGSVDTNGSGLGTYTHNLGIGTNYILMLTARANGAMRFFTITDKSTNTFQVRVTNHDGSTANSVNGITFDYIILDPS